MLKHITLHITQQQLDANGRRTSFQAVIADTDLPNVDATHDVARLVIHTLSIGAASDLTPSGFPYAFPLVFD